MPQPTWRSGTWPWRPAAPGASRLRVIIDNDFAGDPDDLYQVVHHLLSPSVEIRGIICSHLPLGDPWYTDDSAEQARRVMERLAEVMRLDTDGLLFTGSNDSLASRCEPRPTPAAQLIIDEALRTDSDVPLVVVCGGGLTDLASAYLMEPSITDRLLVIWIGGPEHEGLGVRPAGVTDPEYNLRIDVTAAQVVLNDAPFPLWLVPRNMYRQCLVSDAELRLRVADRGPLGAFLYQAIQRVRDLVEVKGGGFGETYALGDSPLVLLTALQSYFQPDPSSSDYVVRPCPEVGDDGEFTDGPGGRPVRVYTRVDTRLMFEDMFLKIDELATWLESC
jgi:purine nucleosidase